ncbi:MAG: transglutaminase-like cysteine peptidase [Pseudomonadota bacterium]
MQVPLPLPRLALAFCLLLLALAAGMRQGTGEPVKAVSFAFTSLDDRPVRLADYQGKWVLVSFWAPWCPLCKVQVPSLNTLNQRSDTRVIGIALDYGADEGSIRQAIRLANMRFDAFVAGGSRRDPNSAQRQVGPVDFFPTSYLYDPQGEIVMFIPGQLRLPRILSFMDNWYAEHGPARAPMLAARSDDLAGMLKRRYGDRGGQAFADWKRMTEAALALPIPDRLARVNDFFNRRIQAGQDSQIWGREDHWATPGELLGVGKGDGEDFAIGKYFTLVALNLPPEKMRLVYVKPRGESRPGAQVHMVLAWYESAGQDPLILDNREPAILPASRRTDLRPVFSFNSLGVWEETAAAASAGESGRLAVWEDTLRRAKAEGFE